MSGNCGDARCGLNKHGSCTLDRADYREINDEANRCGFIRVNDRYLIWKYGVPYKELNCGNCLFYQAGEYSWGTCVNEQVEPHTKGVKVDGKTEYIKSKECFAGSHACQDFKRRWNEVMKESCAYCGHYGTKCDIHNSSFVYGRSDSHGCIYHQPESAVSQQRCGDCTLFAFTNPAETWGACAHGRKDLHKNSFVCGLFKQEEDTMSQYFTKCGRSFNKSTKADTTGYHLEEDEAGKIFDQKCAACPFPVDVKEGYPGVHKRWECRAGSFPPNHENAYNGGAKDKNTLRVYSVDHDFCESVIAFANNHPELGASYNQDLADCRRAVSISCSGNRNGMAAKQELIDKFFPNVSEAPDPIEEHEEICDDCGYYKTMTSDMGNCSLKNMPVSRVRPACEEFGPGFEDRGEDIPDSVDDEEEIFASADLEDQLDALLEKADNFIEKIKQGEDDNDGSEEGLYYCSQDDCPFNNRECDCMFDYEEDAEWSADVDRAIETFCCDNPKVRAMYDEARVSEPVQKKPRFNRGGECQKMQEDCPCFCAHNDGCSVLLASGEALKAFVDQYMKDGVDCDVFQKVAERINGIAVSIPETVENVTEQPELIPDVIKSAEVEQTATFDYSELDEQTTLYLQDKAKTISQIKVRTVHDIGFELSLVHKTLSNHKSGMFGAWCESIGISRRTAENYMQAYEYIAKNFRNIEDAAGIQPSLLFAASKPSAPPELQQAVIDGDITKHKDYVAAMEELKAAQQNAEDWRKGYETQRNATRDIKSHADAETEEKKKLQNRITELEQQASKLKENLDPGKLQELGGVIKEKQDLIKQQEREIAELRDQLNSQPIEVPAVEIREVVPEDIGKAWADSIRSAIKLIASLKETDISRLIRIEGKSNYHYMKAAYRECVNDACENMSQLSEAIVDAIAPAVDFMKWLDDQDLTT